MPGSPTNASPEPVLGRAKPDPWARAHPHPERSEQTVWEVFEEERPKLVAYRGRFDGFHALPASVSKTCLVRFDNNKYSVNASAVGRPVEVQAGAGPRTGVQPDPGADRLVIRQSLPSGWRSQ